MLRSLLHAACAVLLAVLAWTASPVAAQSPAAAASASVDEVLRQGRELERRARWADALTHYEEALRQFPGDAALEQRHNLARVHFDVGRRYNDSSFRRALTTLAERDALATLADVLIKIDTHYVHAPNWRQAVGHGTLTLEIGLSKDDFLRQNLPGVAEARIDAFRSELKEMLARRPMRDRHEAVVAIQAAATLGRSRLGLAPTATVLEYLCGITTALDNYSTYLTPDQLRDVYSQIDGNFVGLGIEIKTVDGALRIVSVIPNSPAALAGLKRDDVITAVDGKATRDVTTDQAANLLQGEDGSLATLTVLTGQQAPRIVRVRRSHVEVPSVEDVKIVDRAGGVAYLRITSFQKTTARDVDSALWQLHRDGMRSLIVDLRGNPGGLLSSSVEIADKFIESGVIVSTRGRSTGEDFNYTAHRVGTWRVPLVVLVDGDSASASEIFAGAIQDNRRGTVVGRRSFGKGSVQGIFPLQPSGGDATGGVRLTTAKFYVPSGRPISGSGITPDVQVQRVAKPVDGRVIQQAGDNDADLAAALQVARRQVAQR